MLVGHVLDVAVSSVGEHALEETEVGMAELLVQAYSEIFRLTPNQAGAILEGW